MAIVYYTKQDEYDLVNSDQYCIGWPVVDQAENKIGTATEMLINTDTEMVDSILVDDRKRIAAQDFALRAKQVVVRGIMHDGKLEMTGGEEVDTTAEAHRTYDQPMRTRQMGEAAATNVAGLTRAANEDEMLIPIIEEKLAVGKRTIESGAARVRTSVTEVPVEESVTLREENVTVTRRPVDRAVENAPAAFQEGTIEVTEMAEVPVVEKEARVVEEVVVGKNVTEHTETVSETVKRTEVDINETTGTRGAPRQND